MSVVDCSGDGWSISSKVQKTPAAGHQFHGQLLQDNRKPKDVSPLLKRFVVDQDCSKKNYKSQPNLTSGLSLRQFQEFKDVCASSTDVDEDQASLVISSTKAVSEGATVLLETVEGMAWHMTFVLVLVMVGFWLTLWGPHNVRLLPDWLKDEFADCLNYYKFDLPNFWFFNFMRDMWLIACMILDNWTDNWMTDN